MVLELEISRRNILKLGIASIAVSSNPSLAFASTNADITHGSRSKNQVALTFHGAGTRKMANAILKEMANASTPMTVFAVGTFLEQQPDIAKVILDAGHDLGNHTMHHLTMTTLSKAKIITEIEECAALLKKMTGTQGKYFRPSGTTVSTSAIRAASIKAGYGPCITYDVDSFDYTDPGAPKVISTIMKKIRPGSIVGMHFGHQSTINALPKLIEQLHAKGLSPVALTDLFS